jgi:hypothetical protein
MDEILSPCSNGAPHTGTQMGGHSFGGNRPATLRLWTGGGHAPEPIGRGRQPLGVARAAFE